MRPLAIVLVLAPLTARAETLSERMARAEDLLRKAQLSQDSSERYALADDAQAQLERVVAEAPRDPVAHLQLAQALSVSDPAHPESCRPGACQRAVTELKRARELDASGAEAARIAFELGIVYSRLAAFDDALAEYDRALKLVETQRLPMQLDDDRTSMLYGNSAETLMALGRLDEAIARYRLAVDHAPVGDREWQLAEWGLGVALDRDEQGEKAHASIKLALDRDPTMGQLSSNDVFFEPAGEKLYYVAMGHEVAGDCAQALTSWRGFLAGSPTSRWARRARGHVQRLERETHCAGDGDRAHVSIGEPMRIDSIRPLVELRQVLRSAEGDLRLCYARVLRSERVQGDLELELEISPFGLFGTRSRIEGGNVESMALRQCVQRAAQSWRFSAIERPDVERLRVLIHFGAPR
jgi:tetratricopeptide (TPR) repeat protein